VFLFKVSYYESFWKSLQKEDSSGPLIFSGKIFLWLLVPIFQGASLLKRCLFGLSSSFRTRLNVPVITIGNVTMGGTGKTTISRLLSDLVYGKSGKVPVILSRGYRSGNKRKILPVSRRGELLLSPENCGDEALLLARWLPYASVILGKKRALTGIWAVENFKPDYIMLDDGHQYWRLERDLNIVTVSAVHGFGNGFLFPRGPLREPMWGLKRADLIVLYQYSESSEARINDLKALIHSENPKVPFIGIDVIPGDLRNVSLIRFSPGLDPGTKIKDPAVKTQDYCETEGNFRLCDGKSHDRAPSLVSLKVMAVSGLGSPESFVATLKGCKARVVDSFSFPDHYRYTVDDIGEIIEKAQACSAEAIVTTEKDEANFVGKGVVERISQSSLPFYVLPVKGQLVDSHEIVLLDVLHKVL
jgi:tetraacyldisaccharide 4'-kinase